MLKMRIFSLAVVLVLMLTVQFVTARTTYASIPSNDTASMLSIRNVSTIQNQAQASFHRFSVDNCLGMPPRELASCRNAIQVDNCLGMPPRELASCRNEAKQFIPNANPIESIFLCLAKEELDRYEDFQPPSIYGDGFPYPDEGNKPCRGNADLDRYEEFQPPSIYGDGFPYPQYLVTY